MSTGDSTSTLQNRGFRPVGVLTYRMELEVWWHEAEKTQLLVFRCGPHALLRGSKHYFVRTVSAEGKTWVRDVGQLHEYLESHFPEMRLAFSHFRDISGRLADQHIRKGTVQTPTVRCPTAADLQRLRSRFEATREDHRSLLTLAGLSSATSGTLGNYLRASQKERERELEEQTELLETAERRAQVFME